MPFDSPENSHSRQSSSGLDWLNLFLAGVLSGFGPFVVLYLVDQGWTQVEIGFVLTVGGLAGLLAQVPAGELLDVVQSKRLLVAIGVVTIACAALVLALLPSFEPVLIAQVCLGLTGAVVGPAVAAISLGLVGNDGLPARLGRNQRFAAIGGFGTAGLMGLLGYLFSNQVIFFTGAALAVPTLVALRRIRPGDIHFARACGAPAGDYHPVRPPRVRRALLHTNRYLLVFASCIVLFQLANASVLPLVSEKLGRDRASSLILSTLIFVPQIVVAILATRVGRSAASWGRRPLLLIGLGALPLRAGCFALIGDPLLLVAVQVLDGISGAVIGILTPLIIADITKGSGRFNLGQGIVGTIGGIGAAVSTTFSGYVAQGYGNAAGFCVIMAVGLAAVAVCWAFMPETKEGAFLAPARHGAEAGEARALDALL
jgi:MFS family permease